MCIFLILSPLPNNWFSRKGWYEGEVNLFLIFLKRFTKAKVRSFLGLQRKESISSTYPHTSPLATPTSAGEHSTGINRYSSCKEVGIGLDLGLLCRTLKHMRREGMRGREGREGKDNFWPSLASGEWVFPRPHWCCLEKGTEWPIPEPGNEGSWSPCAVLKPPSSPRKFTAWGFSRLAYCMYMNSYD